MKNQKIQNMVIALLILIGGTLNAYSKEGAKVNEVETSIVDHDLLGSWKFDKLTCASGAPVNTTIGTYTVNFQFYPNYMFYTGISTYTGKKCISHYNAAPYATAVDGDYRLFQTLLPAGQSSLIVYQHCPTTNTQEDFTFVPDILQYEIVGDSLRIIRSPTTRPNRFCQIGDRVIEHLVRE